MWRNLNLRPRVLLGYGLIVGLALALALFLAWQIGALNSTVKQLNTTATVEAAIGARIAGQVATTQRLVERYLRQPRQENLQSAQFSLQELTAEVARARAALAGSARLQRLNDLEQRLAAYLTTFQSLSALTQEQAPLHTGLNTHLARSNTLLKGALASALEAGAAPADIVPLIEAQASLQQANVWATRMIGEQTPMLGANALAELSAARSLLARNSNALGSAIEISIANTLNEIDQGIADTTKLQQTLEQAQQQRDTQLDEQGRALRQEADLITQESLDTLSAATTMLDQQVRDRQLATFGMLLILFLLALAAGIWFSQAILGPLQQLLATAARLDQSDAPRRWSRALSRIIGLVERAAQIPQEPPKPPAAPTAPPRPKTRRRDPGDDLLP